MSLLSLPSLDIHVDKEKLFRAKTLFLVLLYIVLFMGMFQFVAIDSSNNIDGSWNYTLPGLLHSGQKLGVNVFFNYGPLFERGFVYVNPSATFHDFVVSNIYVLASLVLLLFALVSFMRSWRKELTKFPIVIVSLGLLISLYQIDALFVVTCMFCGLTLLREKRPWAIGLILAGIEIFALFKFSFSLLLVIVGLLVFFQGFKRAELKRTALYWVGFIISFWLVYSLVTLNFDPYHFFQYFYYGSINSIYYNEFMSLPLTLNYKLVLMLLATGSLAGLALLGYLYEKRKFLTWSELPKHFRDFFPVLIIALSSFILFKEAVIRTDGHVAIFLPILVVWAGLLVYFLRTTKLKGLRRYRWVGPAYFVLVAAVFLMITYLLTYAGPQKQVWQTLKGYANSVTHSRLDYGYFKQTRWQSKQSFNERAHELDTLLSQPGAPPKGSEVVDWGNTTLLGDILTRHGYHVLYEPFLQNYAAHPPTLFDPVYINFLKAHPHAYIFEEETEGSVTEYLPTYQLNNYFEYVIHNYQTVARSDNLRQYFLKPVSQVTETCKPYTTQKAHIGNIMAIPQPKLQSDQYLKMRISFSGTLPESVFGLLLKPPEYHLHIYNQDNGEMEWRVTKTTLKHGVVVDPLYLNYHDYVNDVPFQLKHMTINGSLNRWGHLNINYSLCTFKK